MGEQCVYYLLKQGFNVFAGHFTPEVSAPKLRAKLIKMSDEDKTMATLSGDQKAAAWSSRCISVPYNSGSDESVAVAAGIVKVPLQHPVVTRQTPNVLRRTVLRNCAQYPKAEIRMKAVS